VNRQNVKCGCRGIGKKDRESGENISYDKKNLEGRKGGERKELKKPAHPRIGNNEKCVNPQLKKREERIFSKSTAKHNDQRKGGGSPEDERNSPRQDTS